MADEQKGLLARLMTETWPARAGRGILDALMLPGQVAGGILNVQPERPGYWSDTDEARSQLTNQTMMNRASDLGGLMMLGSAPFPSGGLRSGLSDTLYHGSPTKGLSELAPSTRGPLGPGTYTTPAPQVAGHYAGEAGTTYQLPPQTRDIHRGHGHSADAEWFGYKSDQQRLLAAAEPEKQAAVKEIIDKMWSGDGYPQYQRLRSLYGSDEAAQELYKRAGFQGLSGQVDGPEVLLFGSQPTR